jgi:ribonuclease-3
MLLPKHNERLELLGDSILGAAITTLLFKNFPDYEENTLTLMKISLVREEHLAFV